MKYYEKTINENIIYDGKVVRLKLQEVEIQNGMRAKREIINHPGGVAILAYKDEDTILMVEQYRKPFDRLMIELPAGKLEYGEDIEICGRRELEEETGYKANNFKYLGSVVSSPGFCDEKIHLFKASDLVKGSIGGDEDEFINVLEIKKHKVLEMIKSGEITDAKTICAFMY
ncbi:MAG: NUDIX hydrolase [Clostridiaceae bacterium]